MEVVPQPIFHFLEVVPRISGFEFSMEFQARYGFLRLEIKLNDFLWSIFYIYINSNYFGTTSILPPPPSENFELARVS